MRGTKGWGTCCCGSSCGPEQDQKCPGGGEGSPSHPTAFRTSKGRSLSCTGDTVQSADTNELR